VKWLFGEQQALHLITAALYIMQEFQGQVKHMQLAISLLQSVTVFWQIFVYMHHWQTFLLLQKSLEQFPYGERDREIQVLHQWVALETMLVFAIAIANSFYLFTRSCKRNSVLPPFVEYEAASMKNSNHYAEFQRVSLLQHDFLKANEFLIGVFSLFGAPFFISLVFLSEKWLPFFNASDNAERQTHIGCLCIQAAQLLSIWLFIFFAHDVNRVGTAIKLISLLLLVASAIAVIVVVSK